MKIDKNLSEVFDIEVVKEHDVITSDGRVIPPDNNESENDYEKARENLHNILEYGNKGLDLIHNIAVATEDPKSIAVMTEMIRVLTESNIKLIDIHEKRAKLKAKEPGEIEGKVVQNNQQNIFVGTTADLAKMVNNLRDK